MSLLAWKLETRFDTLFCNVATKSDDMLMAIVTSATTWLRLDFFHLTKFGNFDRVRWKRKMCFVKLNTECLNPLTRIYLDNLIVETPSSAPYKYMVSLIDMA